MPKRKLSIFLVCLFCMMYFGTIRSYSIASDDNAKNEKEHAVQDNGSERQQLRDSATDIQIIRDNIQEDKEDLEVYVVYLNEELERTQKRIQELKGKLNAYSKTMSDREKEIVDEAIARNAQYERARQYIRQSYETEYISPFSVEMKLNRNAVFFARNSIYYALIEHEDAVLNKFQQDLDNAIGSKEYSATEYAQLESAIEALEKKEEYIDSIIYHKTDKIRDLGEELFAKNVEIDAYNEAVLLIEAEIAALQQELSGKYNYEAYDGGDFVWPCPDYLFITSDFGYRTGTFAGFHGGVDMAAYTGVEIIAAYEGVVKSCGNRGNMGNYVWISHGDGLETIYMHASAIHVTEGQYVSTGEHIADVGSTGRSSGPHLHFQVMENGQAVTPWGYLVDPRKR